MAPANNTVIKLKRSESGATPPVAGDLQTGEVAVNTADRAIYVKDSNGTVVQIANYAVADATLIFPTGDYGSLTSATMDAFGISTSISFDCKITPAGVLSVQDLGALT